MTTRPNVHGPGHEKTREARTGGHAQSNEVVVVAVAAVVVEAVTLVRLFCFVALVLE